MALRLSLRLLSQGTGGWGRCARACGAGVVVRWGGGSLSIVLAVSLSLALYLSLSLYRAALLMMTASASDLSRGQAGGAREEEGSRAGRARHILAYVRPTEF